MYNTLILKNGDAIWYMSGTGQTRRTWNYFKANFPDAIVLAYGFNQGTDAYIKSMTFDCATTTFSAPGRGGAGGETPTTPPVTTPTTHGMGNASTNIVASSALPALLPETGGMSMNGTVVALAAALATYGAAYFAVNKRRYE